MSFLSFIQTTLQNVSHAIADVPKNAVAAIEKIVAQPAPPPPPPPAPVAVTPFLQPILDQIRTTVATRPQVVPATSPVIKIEPTPVTYGQQYQVQHYNADGSVSLVTIPLSELQKNDQVFDPRLSGLTNTVRKQEATLLAGLHLPPADVQAALAAGVKVDFAMTLKSKESEPLEINLLQTPDMAAELVYNYYTPTETNIASQEDPAADTFSQPGSSDTTVPMFVKITWRPVDTLYECADFDPKTPEEEAIVQQYLKPVRGVSNGSSVDRRKVDALLKQTNVLSKDGLTLELVDTHDLPTAFESISNGKIFKNSALTVMNIGVTDLNKVDLNDILMEELT